MATNTLNSRYDAPDTEWETYSETIPARSLRKGDNVVVNDINGAKDVVADFVVGHKYVTARGSTGTQLFRVPLETPLNVFRRRETKESRALTRAYDKNRALERKLEGDFVAPVHAAVDKINGLIEQDYFVTYQELQGLIESQEEMVIWRRYAAMVEANPDKTHSEVMDEYLAQLKEQMSEGYHMGISRSSNTLSNLMDDARRAAIAEFIRDSRWYW